MNNLREMLPPGDRGTYNATVVKVAKQFSSGLVIFSAKIPTVKNPVNVIGNVGVVLEPNASVVITGVVKKTEEYGVQLSANSIEVKTTDEELAVLKFLADGNVPFFSGEKGRLLVRDFKTDIEKAFKNTSKLKAYCSENQTARAINGFNKNKHLLPIYMATNGGVTKRCAQKIYDKFGDDAAKVIRRNPYSIDDIDGFGFLTADKIALKAGVLYDSDERIRAAIGAVVESAMSENGDCYVSGEDIVVKLRNLIYAQSNLSYSYYNSLGFSNLPSDTSEWEASKLCDLVRNHSKQLDNMLANWSNLAYRDKISKKEGLTFEEIDALDSFCGKRAALEEKAVQLLEDMSIDTTSQSAKEARTQITFQENKAKRFVKIRGANRELAYQTIPMFAMEYDIAQDLIESKSSSPEYTVTDTVINDVIKKIEQRDKIIFDKDQRDAVENTLKNKVSVITGGPGRGKTTIIQAVVDSWVQSGGDRSHVLLLAPTGRASQRMSEAIGNGYKAKTVHRELINVKSHPTEYDMSKYLVIVDESSMIDIILMRRITRAFKDAHLCFVGDVDQLPSVGCGNILEDLIRSGVIVCSKLITSHRNAGSILDNSEIINTGGYIRQLKIDSNFKTVWCDPQNENDKPIDKILKIYPVCVAKYGVENVIVLAAMHAKGQVCVGELNRRLRDIVNPALPDKKEYKRGANGTMLREGDRVINTTNNYELECIKDGFKIYGAFNGETGTIQSINQDENIITVLFDDGKIGFYGSENIGMLMLAYAITYHKAQGSEYKCTICALTTGDFIMLQRKILYTGESRAKQICFFIGHARAFQMAMSNSNGEMGRRHTMLSTRLQELAALDTV